MKDFVLKELKSLNLYTVGQVVKDLANHYANLLVSDKPFFSSMYMIDDFDDYVRKLSIEEVAKLIKDILDWTHNVN